MEIKLVVLGTEVTPYLLAVLTLTDSAVIHSWRTALLPVLSLYLLSYLTTLASPLVKHLVTVVRVGILASLLTLELVL